MDYTDQQLKLIDEGNALRELEQSTGWKVLKERIQAATDGIDRQLLSLPLEDPQGTAFSPELLGREYLRLRHLKSGIQSIPAELQSTIRRADKLLEPPKPATTKP